MKGWGGWGVITLVVNQGGEWRNLEAKPGADCVRRGVVEALWWEGNRNWGGYKKIGFLTILANARGGDEGARRGNVKQEGTLGIFWGEIHGKVKKKRAGSHLTPKGLANLTHGKRRLGHWGVPGLKEKGRTNWEKKRQKTEEWRS